MPAINKLKKEKTGEPDKIGGEPEGFNGEPIKEPTRKI